MKKTSFSRPLFLSVIVLMAVAFSFLNSMISASGNSLEFTSIHIMELKKYKDFDPGPQNGIAEIKKQKSVTHLVYGWYPYWMGSAYVNFRWDLLSHLSFFCLEASSNGSILDDHDWPEDWTGLIASAEAANVPITLTCTLFDSEAINILLGNAGYRSNLIGNLVSECQEGGASGINIDFEGTNLDKPRLVVFMQELRAALSSAIPGSHLSMATPAVDWTGCFDYDQLAASCDQLIPMCYGYHWSGGAPGPVSPLTGSSTWGSYSVQWTIDDYITYGTPRNKLAPGLPYYGYDWVVTGDPSEYPADDGAGNADARTYSYVRSYHSAYSKYWDSNSQVPWYYYYDGGTPHQVWYDDETSLGLKYDLVLSESLAGIGIWALGYDGLYPELWDAIDIHFNASPTPDPSPTPTPASVPSTGQCGILIFVSIFSFILMLLDKKKNI